MSISALPAQYEKLPFTFDVPNDADGILLHVGRADVSGAEGGANAPVTGGSGKRAVHWLLRCPTGEANGVRVSDGVAAQGADDYEVIGAGQESSWPGTKAPEYLRVVKDGAAASRITGWVVVCPA